MEFVKNATGMTVFFRQMKISEKELKKIRQKQELILSAGLLIIIEYFQNINILLSF